MISADRVPMILKLIIYVFFGIKFGIQIRDKQNLPNQLRFSKFTSTLYYDSYAKFDAFSRQNGSFIFSQKEDAQKRKYQKYDI